MKLFLNLCWDSSARGCDISVTGKRIAELASERASSLSCSRLSTTSRQTSRLPLALAHSRRGPRHPRLAPGMHGLSNLCSFDRQLSRNLRFVRCGHYPSDLVLSDGLMLLLGTEINSEIEAAVLARHVLSKGNLASPRMQQLPRADLLHFGVQNSS